MRRTLWMAAVVVAVMASQLVAGTHVLKLKDGRILKGDFLKATDSAVWFQVDGEETETKFDIASILAIHFSSATIQPTIAPKEPITVPTGTMLRVSVVGGLSSLKNSAGEKFFAVLDEDLVVNGEVLVPRSKRVTGRVRKVVKPKRPGSRAVIEVVLISVPVGGKTVPVITNFFGVETDGKGTIYRTGTAKAPSTSIPSFSDGRNLVIPAQTLLEFQLSQPMTIRP